jgi:hypothetical protein
MFDCQHKLQFEAIKDTEECKLPLELLFFRCLKIAWSSSIRIAIYACELNCHRCNCKTLMNLLLTSVWFISLGQALFILRLRSSISSFVLSSQELSWSILFFMGNHEFNFLYVSKTVRFFFVVSKKKSIFIYFHSAWSPLQNQSK